MVRRGFGPKLFSIKKLTFASKLILLKIKLFYRGLCFVVGLSSISSGAIFYLSDDRLLAGSVDAGGDSDSFSHTPTSSFSDFSVVDAAIASGGSDSAGARGEHHSILSSSGGSFEASTEFGVTPSSNAILRSVFDVQFGVTSSSVLDLRIYDSSGGRHSLLASTNSVTLIEVGGATLWEMEWGVSPDDTFGAGEGVTIEIDVEEGVVYQLIASSVVDRERPPSEGADGRFKLSFAIPEPTTSALLLGSLGFLGFRRR